MLHAKPTEIGSGFYPCPEVIRVRDTGIVNLQRRETDPLLKGKLYVGVVQL